jgi:hypothetical protein
VHVVRGGNSGDVPDDRDLRLGILDPEAPHSRGTESEARRVAKEIIESRATGARRYRNQVDFLAADATELVARLMALQGADADIRLDITVRVSGGVPQDVERTVRENARVLKFTSAEFDAEWRCGSAGVRRPHGRNRTSDTGGASA